MKNITFSICLIICIAFFAFQEVSFGIMTYVSLENLYQQSKIITRGQVIEQICEWDKTLSGDKIIVTRVKIKPLENYKGKTEQGYITVTKIGGMIDGIGMTQSDEPEFNNNEEVVVFLGDSITQNSDSKRVIASIQGKMTVSTNKTNGFKAVSRTVEYLQDGKLEKKTESFSLEEFVGIIRKYEGESKTK